MSLFTLTEEYVHILGVVKVADNEALSQVKIYFSNQKYLAITVLEDTDELEIRIAAYERIDIPIAKEFNYLVDCKLIRSWLMTNHKGYQDALQLEVSKDDFEVGYIIQFLVEASEIKILNSSL